MARFPEPNEMESHDDANGFEQVLLGSVSWQQGGDTCNGNSFERHRDHVGPAMEHVVLRLARCQSAAHVHHQTGRDNDGQNQQRASEHPGECHTPGRGPKTSKADTNQTCGLGSPLCCIHLIHFWIVSDRQRYTYFGGIWTGSD